MHWIPVSWRHVPKLSLPVVGHLLLKSLVNCGRNKVLDHNLCLRVGVVAVISCLTFLMVIFLRMFLFKNNSVEVLAVVYYRGQASLFGSKMGQFCTILHNTQTQDS
jgi:hypothetical protein